MGSAIIILTFGDSPQGSESKGHRAWRGRRKVTQDEDGMNFSWERKSIPLSTGMLIPVRKISPELERKEKQLVLLPTL